MYFLFLRFLYRGRSEEDSGEPLLVFLLWRLVVKSFACLLDTLSSPAGGMLFGVSGLLLLLLSLGLHSLC